jgi:hypothetical protein
VDALSAQGNLSEAPPRPDAYNLDRKGQSRGSPSRLCLIVLTTTAPQGAASNQTRSTPAAWGWVHSREHTRVNSSERQGVAVTFVAEIGDVRPANASQKYLKF